MNGPPRLPIERPGQAAPAPALCVVLRCEPALQRKLRYVLDSLLMACGVAAVYREQPPGQGPWLLCAPHKDAALPLARCVAIAHCPQAWALFSGRGDVQAADRGSALPTVFPQTQPGFGDPVTDIGFDLLANAFYFLSSWSERVSPRRPDGRQRHADSATVRLGVPQDIVDRYLLRLCQALDGLARRLALPPLTRRATWPGGAAFAVVLSHDVDFVPSGPMDNAVQGAKSLMRHLLRERKPADAWRAARGLFAALRQGRDPYGCVPEIIAAERARGVRSSFQVAVGHRHPNDVRYRIEDERTRGYLSAIGQAGFDLCLHGSCRSTENPQWYVEEAALLGNRLARPRGSRQHFLSFDYDALFAAQEQAGIDYDMSMGYPDQVGPRAGFSFPYFPYCLAEDRPYRVLQISLFLMDVTLRSYLRLDAAAAAALIDETLQALRRKGGCASVVWHPIVFGGARDPGYDRLYWDLISQVQAAHGLATDGRCIDRAWRERAARYGSFSNTPTEETPWHCS